MAESRLTVLAPAKVNLYLAVGPVLSDGYHRLDTVLQAVDLFDTVTVELAERLEVVTVPDLGIPPDQNIAAKAALRLGEAFGVEPRLRISVSKRIPAAAGLGGGSSDAAAVLLAGARLLGLPEEELPEIAAAIGTDVPFFLQGGTALYTHRGDRLVRRLRTPSLHLALVKPQSGVETAAAYKEYDSSPSTVAHSTDAIEDALASGMASEIASALRNDLAGAALRLAPEAAEALAFVQGHPDVAGATVSGSGAAVFAVCGSRDAAFGVAREGGLRQGWSAFAVDAIDRGVSVVEG